MPRINPAVFVGYAPDERGRDHPLEVVYLTERDTYFHEHVGNFLWRFWKLTLWKKFLFLNLVAFVGIWVAGALLWMGLL